MIMHGSGKSGMSGGMNAGGVACAFSCCVCCWYMPVMTFTDIEKSEHGITVSCILSMKLYVVVSTRWKLGAPLQC